jgi:glycine/D-amino acid oxidase-like deaminating enzyme
MAVPRGVAPGAFSKPGSPIYVAIPAGAWDEVYLVTPEDRREDLVWVGNGLPRHQASTVVVPHFGILAVGGDPVTSPLSPPTFVHGKHALQLRDILTGHGIKVQIIHSWADVQIYAAMKLLWSSCMWLLCHSDDPPLTVKEVHDRKEAELNELLSELLPCLADFIGKPTELSAIVEYMKSYSLSMPTAVPSIELAINEVQHRNGVWLAYREKFLQPFHTSLLNAVGVDWANQELSNTVELSKHTVHTCHIPELELTVLGREVATGSRPATKTAIVIGAGILGTSAAFHLAKEGVHVTVYDELSADQVGRTTPASWAWINANQKSPAHYKWLNQLGMRGWRTNTIIKDLPIWNGAIVQFNETQTFHGGYAVEGPLAAKRIQQLEPNANFSFTEGPVYFFSDEGSVDPIEAVLALKVEAVKLGVNFVPSVKCTGLLRGNGGRVIGIESAGSTIKEADVVLVAAGVGSSASALGGMPLISSPGRISFARPKYDVRESPDSVRINRILVDTVRQCHVLQRRDGTLVAGGGMLEVGGTTSAANSGACASSFSDDKGLQIVAAAKQLSPQTISRSSFSHSAAAIRPMPKDGLPIVGFIEHGLYCVVTHSGITIAPLLGALIAHELSLQLDLDVLKPYRPTRLAKRE